MSKSKVVFAVVVVLLLFIIAALLAVIAFSPQPSLTRPPTVTIDSAAATQTFVAEFALTHAPTIDAIATGAAEALAGG